MSFFPLGREARTDQKEAAKLTVTVSEEDSVDR
jgi:hypothetical protein